jgi:site-specific recombinase XerD
MSSSLHYATHLQFCANALLLNRLSIRGFSKQHSVLYVFLKNTREAHFPAVSRFFDWCQKRSLALDDIRPVHVATYIEGFTVGLSDPSVKQHLAAIKMLFDWLVIGQIVDFNPAAAVRGPKHFV